MKRRNMRPLYFLEFVENEAGLRAKHYARVGNTRLMREFLNIQAYVRLEILEFIPATTAEKPESLATE